MKFPPLERFAHEVAVQLVGVLIAAWIIGKVPAFKAILTGAVASGNVLSPLDNLPLKGVSP